MYDSGELIKQAIDEGFTQGCELNLAALTFMPEVRAMCSADKCRSYGKNWRCPPACGTLEHAAEIVKGYSFGIIVQTVGQMEDEFDIEAIEEAGARHKRNFARLVDKLKERYGDVLPMSAGTCTICEECAYPDPCRFPDKAMTSMEAYGLWVSRVCEQSGIPYNNGKNTITYTSCYLLK
jgi:predicted metal-binding protein